MKLAEPPSVSFATEERRIRGAFAQRRKGAPYAWSTPAYVFTMQGVERRLLRFLAASGMASLSGKSILEIGCGTGHWLREFVKWGAHPHDVVGMDLLGDRLGEARTLCPQAVQLFCGSAAGLPLPAASFDLVAQFTVFTSILEPALKRHVAFEMLRVVKPTGLILWYDFFFDNPKNVNVRGIARREIQRLFPGCCLKLQRVTLAPPLTRRLASRSWLACSLLEAIPLLRTHLLGVIRKG